MAGTYGLRQAVNYTEPMVTVALAAATDDLVARRLLGAAAGLVAVEVSRLELPQRELSEGIARAQLHELASEAFAPHLFVSDHRPGRAAPVLPVDLVNAGGADRPALVLDRPEHAVRITRHLVEPLVLRGQIQGVPTPEEMRDLHVLEPAHHRRSVVGPWGTEADELALDDGPVHGPKG